MRLLYIMAIIAAAFFLMAAECEQQEIMDDKLDGTGQKQIPLSQAGASTQDDTQKTTGIACPGSCDDLDSCTQDFCSEETAYVCVNELIIPCCGNDICESEEDFSSCDLDCPRPQCPALDKECFENVFDEVRGECRIKIVPGCCGNDVCDFDESCSSCAKDCGSCEDRIDLSDYPDMLSEPVYIIVGSKGTGMDVFASSSIATALASKSIATETKFTTDISMIGEKDSVFVGSPCTDPMIQEYFGLTDCNNFLQDNRARIKLSQINGHIVIFVSGKTSEDTRSAAKFLSDYKNFAPGGDDMLVDTSSKDNPKKIS